MNLTLAKNSVEVFRSYTDCIYSAYGNSGNGNAAAYNGSLFVSQNGRLRRLTPLECERFDGGLPDNYTDLPGAKTTSRYQSGWKFWAVPVSNYGQRIADSLIGKAEPIFQHIPEYLNGTRPGTLRALVPWQRANPSE